MKRISIILCTYNGEKYLKEQLDSLLRQTYPFDELIVQDDGSTDGTCRMVADYRQQHPDRNIQLFVNAGRLGYSRNFLTAICRASGEYIACCDQDDIWFDEKLETLMQQVGDSSLIFHNSLLIDDRHEEHGLLYARPLPEFPSSLSSALYPHAYGHTLLFSAKVKERLRAFVDVPVSYDYLTYTVAGSIGTIRYLKQPLVYWRRHEGAATYAPATEGASKWRGYEDALKAFYRPDNRERTRRYFALLTQLPFRDATARKAVCYMATGSGLDILRVCLLCLRHTSDAAQGITGVVKWARAFFLPLFFIRDHGRYIFNLTNV